MGGADRMVWGLGLWLVVTPLAVPVGIPLGVANCTRYLVRVPLTRRKPRSYFVKDLFLVLALRIRADNHTHITHGAHQLYVL